MATVVLYNPKEKVRLKVPYLPFSLMAVGTALKKAGIDVIIIDGRLEKNPRAAVCAALNAHPLFFGITVMTGSMIYDALETAQLVKNITPQLPVVLGGVHPSLLPEQTAGHTLVDIVVIGPGEKTALDLAKHIQMQRPFDTVAGIAYRRNGTVALNPQETGADPSFFSGIDYALIDLRRYIKREAAGNRCLDYLSSRGCPHRCAYCSIAQVWGRKMIMYSSTDMVNTIERFVREFAIDGIHLTDDNFFVDKKRVEEFCDEVIARKLSLRFWATCRINYFAHYDDAFLTKLKRAGFYTLNFGAESGSQYILDKIKKDITPAQIRAVARTCDAYGFRGQFSFMMAFPFEKKEDLKLTMAMIDDIHAVNKRFDCQLFPFVPFPETDLAHESRQYGFTPPAALEQWADFEYGNIVMPWLSHTDKKRIDTLTTIAWFGFTSETAVKLGGIQGVLFRFFGSLARLRWRHRFFSWPIEWKIINFFARR